MTVAHATPQQVLDAIDVLASCDHFDESRRAARDLPTGLPIVDVLRAADGATRLAREADRLRRTSR